MPTKCRLLGELVSSAGVPIPLARVTFTPKDGAIRPLPPLTIVPEVETGRTDENGQLLALDGGPFEVYPGVYSIRVKQGLHPAYPTMTGTVPEAETALLSDIQNLTPPVPLNEAQLAVLAAQDARDEAREAAVEAASEAIAQVVEDVVPAVTSAAVTEALAQVGAELDEKVSAAEQAREGAVTAAGTAAAEAAAEVEVLLDGKVTAAEDARSAAEGSAGAAATQAGLASAAKTAAETARDASIAAGVVVGAYASTAAGIAAVAEGAKFWAPSADGLTLQQYTKTGGAAVAVTGNAISTETATARIALRDAGFLTTPARSNPLSRVLKLELKLAVSGAEIVLPALLCVREIARDSLNRFRFRLASFDGSSTYGVLSLENPTGIGSINVAGLTGLVWMNIYASGTALGVPNLTEIGRALIDFRTGDTFGTYNTTIAYAEGAITPSFQQSSPVLVSDTDERINAAAQIVPGAKIPFANEMVGNSLLRRLVRSVAVYGADPTHEYAIQTFEVRQISGTSTRISVSLSDVTAGTEVARYTYLVGSLVTYATITGTAGRFLHLDDRVVGVRTGVTAFLEVEWSASSDLFLNIGSATMSGAGVHPSCINSDAGNDYAETSAASVLIRVGSAEAETALVDAVEAIYSPITGASQIIGSPVCEFANQKNPVRFELVDEATYTADGLFMPWYTEIKGAGMDRTIITHPGASAEPVLEVRGSFKCSDVTVYSANAGEYCFHSDNFNRHVVGGKRQNVHIAQVYERVRMMGCPGHDGWLFGCGLSSGDDIRFTDVVGEHLDSTATAPAFGFHNSGPTLAQPGFATSYKPASVTMLGCSSPDQVGVVLDTLEPSAICTLTLFDCAFNLIKLGTASGNEVLSDLARSRNAWRIGGRHDGPWLRNDAIGENVLKTTAGQTPSGSASPLIFGAMDELGRGEKWINGVTGAIYSLGARLGDCSLVNKTLTIGGQTHTFTTNLTAVSNDTILAAINASITSHPLTVVDLQHEWVPDAAPKRRVRNSTGATIPKGRFVKFTGTATVELCGLGDRPDAWTHRDILAGTDGCVVLTRQISSVHIARGIADVNVTAGGSGGTDGVFPLVFSGGGGSGATGTFTVLAGSVASISLTAGGINYTSAPSVDFSASPGLTGASASVETTGEWGIGAGGAIDHLATLKLGRTVGHICTLW
jgi:hypothetical protein